MRQKLKVKRISLISILKNRKTNDKQKYNGGTYEISRINSVWYQCEK